MQTFELLLTVTKDDLDDLKHVNNVRYVQWVQDIAKQHWNSKATQNIQDTYFWVLLSHHIHYKGQAILDDVLKLKTYIKKSEGVTSIRIVEIYNNNTNKLLVTSEAVWCLMSHTTKRPSRITAEIANLFKTT